jgi:cell division protein FtsZ
MGKKPQMTKVTEIKPRITVVGVGGAGGNAINNMIAAGLSGAHFVVANTDVQALAASSAENRVQLGLELTDGLGAGAKPEIGEAAAEEALEDIRAQLTGSHMVFIAAGMGGGTGTGAAAVIARVAKEFGILTVAVVTKPFQFEGSRRMRLAEIGIAELRRHVDTLIVIPNQNLFKIATDRTTFAEAFVMADQVLYSGVACIVDLIVKDGLINLDLADVKTVLSGMGTAMMGTGEASGEQRAVVAAEEAIVNPLLDDVTLRGAKSVLLSITGARGMMTLWEVDTAANRVRREIDSDAIFIFGAAFDDTLGDKIRVSIVASGMARSSLPQSAEAPAWTPRGQRLPSKNEEDYRRRLSEAIDDIGPHEDAGADDGHGDSRRAPGDVFIREGTPQILGQLRAAKNQPGGEQPTHGSAPEGAAKRGGRRQAPVDGGFWPRESDDPGGSQEPPSVYRQQPEPERKAGFLRRITGVGRSRRDDGRRAERQDDYASNAPTSQQDEERLELPPFFARNRK